MLCDFLSYEDKPLFGGSSKTKKCAPYWYVKDFCTSESNKAQRWIGRGSMYGYYTT